MTVHITKTRLIRINNQGSNIYIDDCDTLTRRNIDFLYGHYDRTEADPEHGY